MSWCSSSLKTIHQRLQAMQLHAWSKILAEIKWNNISCWKMASRSISSPRRRHERVRTPPYNEKRKGREMPPHPHGEPAKKKAIICIWVRGQKKKSQLHGYKQVLVYTCKTHNSCGLYFPPSDSASANLQLNKTRKIHFQLCLLRFIRIHSWRQHPSTDGFLYSSNCLLNNALTL